MSTFVDGLVEFDREQHFERAMKQFQQTEAALAAEHDARVVATMAEFTFDRDEAERFIEIEDVMAGVDRMKCKQEDRS